MINVFFYIAERLAFVEKTMQIGDKEASWPIDQSELECRNDYKSQMVKLSRYLKARTKQVNTIFLFSKNPL